MSPAPSPLSSLLVTSIHVHCDSDQLAWALGECGLFLYRLKSNSGKYHSFPSIGDIKFCINILWLDLIASLWMVCVLHCKSSYSLLQTIPECCPTCWILRKWSQEDVSMAGRSIDHKVWEKQEAAFCVFLVLAVSLRLHQNNNKAVLSENGTN